MKAVLPPRSANISVVKRDTSSAQVICEGDQGLTSFIRVEDKWEDERPECSPYVLEQKSQCRCFCSKSSGCNLGHGDICRRPDRDVVQPAVDEDESCDSFTRFRCSDDRNPSCEKEENSQDDKTV